jgi:hypothetical protein
MIEDRDSELIEYFKQGYSYEHIFFNGYVKYILFYKGVEVLTWKTDCIRFGAGMAHDMPDKNMIHIIKKYISDKRDQKLIELGI